MTDRTKSFIEKHLDLIDRNEWPELQVAATVSLGEFYHEFNACMVNAGINPMECMNIIPGRSMMYCPVDDYEIPSTVQIIGMKAFEGAGFDKIIIPEGVVEIGFRAFAECPRLETVYLPSTIKELKGAIFMHCPNLSKIVYNGSSDDFDKIIKSTADSPFTWYTVSTDLHRVKAVVDCHDAFIKIGAYGR